MFQKALSKFGRNIASLGAPALCDDVSNDSLPTLVEQADAESYVRSSIRPPMQFEDVQSQLIGSAAVNSFDGFRLMVAKQVNLNTVSQHTFMLGSSQTQNQPYYNYTLILPMDERQERNIRIRSDLDFNIEGEFSYPLGEGIQSKSTLQLSDNGDSINVDINMNDSNSTSQIGLNYAKAPTLSFSFMQALFPWLSLGGSSTYAVSKQAFNTTLCGILTDSYGNLFAGTYDTTSKNATPVIWLESQDSLGGMGVALVNLVYKKEVNPNRVNLLTDLTYDGSSGKSKMNVSGQYILKQSKISIGVDSDLVMRSTLESNVAPSVVLTLSAEIPQLQQDQCRFGYGLLMG